MRMYSLYPWLVLKRVQGTRTHHSVPTACFKMGTVHENISFCTHNSRQRGYNVRIIRVCAHDISAVGVRPV